MIVPHMWYGRGMRGGVVGNFDGGVEGEHDRWHSRGTRNGTYPQLLGIDRVPWQGNLNGVMKVCLAGDTRS